MPASPSNGSSRKRARKKLLRCAAWPLTAPDLLIAECANILWKKVRRSELSEREAAFAAGLLARADIDLVAMRPYPETAVRIALALDHPAYDCVYIALAEAEGLRLVTADQHSGARKSAPADLSTS